VINVQLAYQLASLISDSVKEGQLIVDFRTSELT